MSYLKTSCGCWIWLGEENRNGYGRFKRRGKKIMAHKYYFQLFKGPIQRGLVLDHLCRNRACVNPEHLEPVTVQVNTLRGEAKLFGRGR